MPVGASVAGNAPIVAHARTAYRQHQKGHRDDQQRRHSRSRSRCSANRWR